MKAKAVGLLTSSHCCCPSAFTTVLAQNAALLDFKLGKTRNVQQNVLLYQHFSCFCLLKMFELLLDYKPNIVWLKVISAVIVSFSVSCGSLRLCQGDWNLALTFIKLKACHTKCSSFPSIHFNLLICITCHESSATSRLIMEQKDGSRLYESSRKDYGKSIFRRRCAWYRLLTKKMSTLCLGRYSLFVGRIFIPAVDLMVLQNKIVRAYQWHPYTQCFPRSINLNKCVK